MQGGTIRNWLQPQPEAIVAHLPTLPLVASITPAALPFLPPTNPLLPLLLPPSLFPLTPFPVLHARSLVVAEPNFRKCRRLRLEQLCEDLAVLTRVGVGRGRKRGRRAAHVPEGTRTIVEGG